MRYPLEELIDNDCSLTIVEINMTDPARTGLGVAQNKRLRRQAAALSLLVPLLLDRSTTTQDIFLDSLCKLAKTKRPTEG